LIGIIDFRNEGLSTKAHLGNGTPDFCLLGVVVGNGGSGLSINGAGESGSGGGLVLPCSSSNSGIRAGALGDWHRSVFVALTSGDHEGGDGLVAGINEGPGESIGLDGGLHVSFGHGSGAAVGNIHSHEHGECGSGNSTHLGGTGTIGREVSDVNLGIADGQKAGK